MKNKKQNDKLKMNLLEKCLTFKYLDNSYKLLWLKGILEQVKKGHTTIEFDTLAIEMLAESWEFVFEKNLTYGRLDKVHRILEEIDEKWHVDTSLDKEGAYVLLESIGTDELSPLLSELYQDTPYRFLEPIYEAQLKGKKENIKNKEIEELLQKDNQGFYRVDTLHKKLIVNKEWANWLKVNGKAVDYLIKDTMAYYLDKNAGKR